MKIILIGNGPSVLKNKLGQEIDQFDIVVRFNNFETLSYEEYVGNKCDFLCRRACDDVKWHLKETFKQVYVFVPNCKWLQWMSPVVEQVKQFYQEKCVVVDTDYTTKTARKLNQFDPQTKWPSIGVLTIDYFLQYFNEITIHGFDHLRKESDGQIKHYYNTPPKDACYHDGQVEQEFVSKLIKQGKIRRLV